MLFQGEQLSTSEGVENLACPIIAACDEPIDK
jgi:hypothetical protein